MKYLKATTIEGKREFFNLDKIMTIQENADGTRLKIFMGAGLYWWVWADSLRITDIREILADMDETMVDINEITGGTN
jgi:hypothetical protein